MKTFIKIFLIFLILIPESFAWKAETHQNIIEYIYLHLPEDTQMQLDLKKLKEGSVMPDRNFKDFKKHHYPDSLKEAEKWLNNNSDKSLNIGVASHYITDSFSAPHQVSRESYYDHSRFEGQVEHYYPDVECRDYGFSLDDLGKASKNSNDWAYWLKTKNKIVPQREVNDATKFMFSIILKELNTTCNNFNTKAVEKPYITRNKLIAITAVFVLALFLLKK